MKAYRLNRFFNAKSKRCFEVALVPEDDTPEEAARHLS
jgi:hypothetical protein